MRLRPGFLYSSFFGGSSVKATIENPYLEVEVLPFWFDRATLSWKIPSDWGDCSFNVYKSRSDAGPFEKLNVSPIQGLTFLDVSARNFAKNLPDFYIVEAILHDKGGALLKSAPTSWEKKQTEWVKLRSIEIQRRFWLMLRKFMGVETYVFKRRYFGKRCTSCWDYANQKVTNDKCTECLGTGWSGGYLDPYKTLMQYDTTPNDTDASVYGKIEPNVLVAQAISFPDISDWDVVYRQKDGRMYRVDSVANTELLTNKVSQKLQLVELPKNYAEYQLVDRIPK